MVMAALGLFYRGS